MPKRQNKNEDVNIYNAYLRDIRKYKMMDDATTRGYLNSYRNGTDKEKRIAKEKIVCGHQRYVLSVANKFKRGDNIMDIINEGNIGLMKAIDEYDIDSEVKFTTYAMYWIRKTIMSYITISEPMIVPNNAFRLSTYLPKIRREFMNENYRQPTTEEIQDILQNKYNINLKHKEDLMGYTPTSIDEKYERDDDGQEFMETNLYTSKTASCDVEEMTKRNDEILVVNRILSKFNERDAYIIRSIYGIDCPQKRMDEVANEMGITCERVRQIAVNGVQNIGKQCLGLANSY